MSTLLNDKSPPPPNLPAERLMRAERVGALRHFGRWLDIANACLVLMASVAFWGVRSPQMTVAWIACMLAVSAARLVMSWAYPLLVLSEKGRDTWQEVFLVFSLGLGILWGLAGWIFFQGDSTVHQIALTALLTAAAVLPAMVFATHRQIYLAYLASLFAPLMLRLMSGMNVEGMLITLASLAVLAVLWLLADEGGREILSNLRFRLAYRDVRSRLADEVTTRT